MEKIINAFLQEVSQRNSNEPEFMQAVSEVAQTVIPYIVANDIYHGKKHPHAYGRTRARGYVSCALD
jgi:hypothetical protein